MCRAYLYKINVLNSPLFPSYGISEVICSQDEIIAREHSLTCSEIMTRTPLNITPLNHLTIAEMIGKLVKLYINYKEKFK